MAPPQGIGTTGMDVPYCFPANPMNRRYKLLTASSIPLALGFLLPVFAGEATRISPSALWQDRDIRSLNLIYGSGGKEHQPAGRFTFVKEDTGGTSPKFEIVDEQGVHWKAKLGEETQSETAATRLVWAAGYFTDEDYYMPKLRVQKLPKLERGRQYVSAGGVVRGVRLERVIKGRKKNGDWSWFKNPLAGTKELNGLRVMMALMNNWDLKEVNNVIYEKQGEQPRYVISDLGATFGRTGNTLSRSKSNLADYRKTKFIKNVEGQQVDFHLSSRPFLPIAVNVPYYVERTNMQDIVKDIPRAHAKWLGRLLGQLSAGQIRDCFRAAGYSRSEVEGFAKVVQLRIAALNKL
jgi:hypothetical protein